MHPIEQLRHVARAGSVDAALLAAEAADALERLADDPRALVPSCRRLLDFHPDAGPLWWLAARVLASSDPAKAAREAGRLLLEDPTDEELAAALPAGAVLAATGAPVIAAALSARPDCSIRLVGGPLELRHGLRRIAEGPGGAGAVGFPPEEAVDAVTDATLVLVEAVAAGRDGAVLTWSATLLAEAARAASVPLWLVAGVGRVLAPELFAACAERAEPGLLLPAAAVDVVVGDRGAQPPASGLAGADCPSPPELVYRPRG